MFRRRGVTLIQGPADSGLYAGGTLTQAISAGNLTFSRCPRLTLSQTR